VICTTLEFQWMFMQKYWLSLGRGLMIWDASILVSVANFLAIYL